MNEMTKIINEVYDSVSNSKFGPIFYDCIQDKIVTLDSILQPGADAKATIKQNTVSMEVFRICLLSRLGYKMQATVKEEGIGEDWKQ